MRKKHHRGIGFGFSAGVLIALVSLGGCGSAKADNDASQEKFPTDYHALIPMLPRNQTQVSAGVVTGEAPLQPIAFPHDRHVQVAKIQCQYCHSAARNSIHAGVPELQTCLGCHKNGNVLKDSPEIQLLLEYGKRGEPIPWTRVHDLPDFVTFSHMRHVRAGVDCTECHGQVQTMAGHRVKPKAEGESGRAEAAEPITTAEQAAEQLGPVHDTMTREATLQMGWCLDCHASHPSIEKNYGEHEDLRRAELKDCWTCHK